MRESDAGGTALAATATLARPPRDAVRRRERRAVHRVPCRLRLCEDGVTLSGETVNISSTGLAVHVGCAIPHGTLVEAIVPQLEGEPLRVTGAVVHTRRVLTGTFEVGIHTT
jgi:hypothetical protein